VAHQEWLKPEPGRVADLSKTAGAAGRDDRSRLKGIDRLHRQWKNRGPVTFCDPGPTAWTVALDRVTGRFDRPRGRRVAMDPTGPGSTIPLGEPG